jgi:hypothetical protein
VDFEIRLPCILDESVHPLQFSMYSVSSSGWPASHIARYNWCISSSDHCVSLCNDGIWSWSLSWHYKTTTKCPIRDLSEWGIRYPVFGSCWSCFDGS